MAAHSPTMPAFKQQLTRHWDSQAHRGQVERVLVNQVDDAAGGAHHNFHAPAQLLELRADGVAAVVAAHAQGGGGAGNLALHLRWRQWIAVRWFSGCRPLAEELKSSKCHL